MAMIEALAAFREERAARPRVARTPLLVRAARLAARVLPHARQLRTAALSVTGFGLLSAAAWTVAVPFGLAAAGLSFLLIEFLTRDGS